ncbi:PASTA domain-containing protein [Cryobacterium sp. GrIS_2_6]|uniref:PASTA domain-containing protein n=1 Tax=Cryobacterium sp. GrIS_2_6 TaxID=3162785 RepID=UPI002DF9106D|nr:beta-lactam-binding protein with PASTA domain [Cryobacterium psychrotolerans]
MHADSFVATAVLAAQAATIKDKALPPESKTWRATAQDKAAGIAIARKTVISLTLEWPGASVPSLVGLTNAQAESALKEIGFSPKLEIANPSDWPVYKQDPASGSALLWGSTVTYAVQRPTSGTIEFRVTGNGSAATVTWIPPRTFSVQQATDASLPGSQTFDNYSTTSSS